MTKYDFLAFVVLACITLAMGVTLMAAPAQSQTEDIQPTDETAIFAAGCFWCIEKEMEAVKGVKDAVSGYIGGEIKNPTYEQVSSGKTGHREAVRVIFDPEQVTYAELLEVFWRNIDPLNKRGQFCDVGVQYTTAVFYQNEQQQKLAEQTKRAKEDKIGQSIITDILPADEFYQAEDYHQGFYKKNPFRYKVYSTQCGRDERLKDVWDE